MRILHDSFIIQDIVILFHLEIYTLDFTETTHCPLFLEIDHSEEGILRNVVPFTQHLFECLLCAQYSAIDIRVANLIKCASYLNVLHSYLQEWWSFWASVEEGTDWKIREEGTEKRPQ